MRAILLGGGIALLLSLLGTRYAIRAMEQLGFGQPIRDDGPTSHHVKRGTPTMGGLVVIGATVLGYFSAKLITLTAPSASAYLLLYLMVGAGIVGFLDDFIKVRQQHSAGLPGRAGRFIADHPVVFAALCGLGVAICGKLSGGTVYGTGYAEAKAILHGDTPDAFGFGPWKFAATALSAISGIPGGIFAPSLAIGAGLAQDLTLVFHSAPVGALVLIGMVSYLTGVVQAPVHGRFGATEDCGKLRAALPLELVQDEGFTLQRGELRQRRVE